MGPATGGAGRRWAVAGVVAALVAGVAAVGGPATAEPPVPAGAAVRSEPGALPDGRTVMLVGNNWDGTVTIVDARTRKALGTIDVVPDKQAELRSIYLRPDRLLLYLAIQQVVAEGHDQYVDDIFTTRDGRYLAVSRPSLADVVWIDLAKAVAGRKDSIVAEASMDGFRTDHMGVSPDRRRLLVSDSTERQVIEFSMVDEVLPDGTKVTMGQRLRTFPSGDTPHENNYSKDGRRIYHASIGRVYTPGDYGYLGPIDVDLVHDAIKADRWLQVVREEDFSILRRWDMGRELEEFGRDDMSSAVRPVAITPDEKTMYAQVSFFHGLVEFSLDAPDPTGGGDYVLGGEPEPAVGRVTRLIDLPVKESVRWLPREKYVLDSAHHGLAINERGTKLCVAGTMSDYAAIVDRSTFTPTVLQGRGRFLTDRSYSKPYWATEGPGNTCWMSMSGSDLVTVISFAEEEVVAEIPVGDHPQRVREGTVRESVLRGF
ncbi:serine/threonine protein kinase [Nocardioides caldifontis]|uniref:serine/threonine protein kinase n=1 Tax=Nocardioides caldifontis TaxID=2588938 RepID=UPI0019395E26|nr:serine/threonine protein kinase [Nocardioides caldifontis]